MLSLTSAISYKISDKIQEKEATTGQGGSHRVPVRLFDSRALKAQSKA